MLIICSYYILLHKNYYFPHKIKFTKNIQLSKVEFVDKNEIKLIIKDIKELNPDAKIFDKDYKNNNIDYWNNLFDGNLIKKEKDDLIYSQEKLENISYENSKASSIESLTFFIDKIMLGYYGNIFRAKGLFKVYDFYIRFDLVDTNYELSFLKDKENNNAVFIGNDIKKDLLKKDLELL